MKLAASRSPSVRDDHLIPLINIIFLLLIFFMVIGQITASDPLAVKPPVSSSAAEDDRERLLVLLNPAGEMVVDGQPVSPDALGHWLLHHRTGKADPAGQPLSRRVPRVAVKADAGVPAHLLRAAFEQLRQAGVDSVVLVTELVQP